jgi:hypothetical protein
MRFLGLMAILPILLPIPAHAVDGTPPDPAACHSFSAANAQMKERLPDLTVAKLTDVQRAHLAKISNLDDFPGVDVYVVQSPSDPVVILALVKEDCLQAVERAPAAALQEILGTDI